MQGKFVRICDYEVWEIFGSIFHVTVALITLMDNL